ncbi:SpoIIE family protein phosphatase [Limisphaera ngatamarikiensis]|uniref:SpoIIE family protein phosphatase n=1 Tax=Limisphaera ngatamarikiensis TaxID=1324935 RepID=A0A6M1RRG0_9BACT|nr:SpoIIE family protein phosphatase [Limisphaera ngatamarikiensis]NGO39987.1 SpoIIE family protein phosphatase [Limisphaera ngatamarikiensis]
MPERPLRILVVEHDPPTAEKLTALLRQAWDTAPEIVVVPSLGEAVQRLGRESFDVALVDFALPDGAGLANLPLLKNAAPRVPLVVVGDADDESVASEAVHAGAQDYLLKSQLDMRWLRRSLRYAMERHAAEMALLDAEARYREVFDHLTEGIFRTTPDGRYLMANRALARIYGYSSPEELMRSITDIGSTLYVQPGRREEFMRLMEQHDVLTNFESPVFRRDGRIIWISENCRAVRDASGRLLYYEGTVRDITERRIAEERLRNSEALYHSLVETLPQNIFRKDIQGRFTFANQQFCRTLGRPLEAILGKTDFDFYPPELASKYQRDDARVIATGQTLNLVEEHRLPDGRTLYVQVVKTPLRGAHNQIIGLQGIFWDITEQRLAEQRIRQANEELARSQAELKRKNAQMAEELRMAREIQMSLLPQHTPVFPPGATPERQALMFTQRYQPTGEVGGDFYYVSALSETEASVFLCDVAGHGVRSALITAVIRALLEELKPLARDPGALLTRLNQELLNILRHADASILTTACCLVADAATGTLRYANAGHPRPFHVQRAAGEVRPLPRATPRPQPALGLVETATYQNAEVTLQPSDLVMLYTDGLYEVHNAAQELYSTEQLEAAVRARLQEPTPELFDHLLAEVRTFAEKQEFEDDVCLLGVDFIQYLSLR